MVLGQRWKKDKRVHGGGYWTSYPTHKPGKRRTTRTARRRAREVAAEDAAREVFSEAESDETLHLGADDAAQPAADASHPTADAAYLRGFSRWVDEGSPTRELAPHPSLSRRRLKFLMQCYVSHVRNGTAMDDALEHLAAQMGGHPSREEVARFVL